jgi:hypothetical protein
MNWESCFIGMGWKAGELGMSASEIHCIGEYDGTLNLGWTNLTRAFIMVLLSTTAKVDA